MHIALTIAIILMAWKWADWKNWQKYHTTMLYVTMANLLYNFIYYDHYLWQMKADILPNDIIVEILYTFIVFPFTALLFLTNYPTTIKGQIIRNIKFITVYIILEWIYYKFGRIVHNYGWHMGWSLAWDSFMFPLWALHHKRPLIAYGASFMVVVLTLLIFPVDFI